MTLSILDRYITQTDSGITVPSAVVTIYTELGVEADLFEDKDGVIPVDNPVTADANGRIKVYMTSGKYSASASFDGDVVNYPDILVGGKADETELNIDGIKTNVQSYLSDKSVDSIADLRDGLLSGNYGVGSTVYVKSTGGEVFIVEDFESQVDDGGITVVGGSFAAVRKVESVVHLSFFEPTADGVTGDTGKINKALDAGYGIVDLDGLELFVTGILYVKSNTVFRNGTLSYDNATGNSFSCNGTENIVIENIRFIGNTPGLISLRNGAKNITIQNCIFDSTAGAAGTLSQLLWLFDCSNVKFLNNTLVSCGYGVITQVGYKSNDVIISFNHISDSRSDFVEANGANVKSSNWTVTNNIYTGSYNWPVVQTERRFAGFTEVEHVIISNNIISNVSGDSAIHLEDLYGETIISSNIFNNWLGTACIYNLNADEDCLITGNIFRRTEAIDTFPPAISTSSNSYDHTVTISNNRFEDFIDDEYRFLAISARESGRFLIEGNQSRNCSALVSTAGTNGTSIVNNKIVNCTAGIISNVTPSGVTETTSSGSNVLVANNHIDVTDTDMGIVATTNASGTNGPKGWLVTGNHTNGNIRMTSSSGSIGSTLYNAASGNYMRSGSSVSISNYGGTGKLSADADGNFIEP